MLPPAEIPPRSSAKHANSTAPKPPMLLRNPPRHPIAGDWGISRLRDRWLFRDSTLERLEFLLDEAFPIPGTGIRVGLDGILGLIPGLGDVLAGVLSLLIPLAAWVRGVPLVTLFRMALNLAIGVLVGSIPILGDAFDIAWKANRRNFRLLQRHLTQPRRHTWKDWAFLWLLFLFLLASFAAPILLLAWLATWIAAGIAHGFGHGSGHA